MECTSIYYAPVETNVAADVITTSLMLVNCFGDIGPMQGNVASINATSQMKQAIQINNCNFYTGQTGTNLVTRFLSAPGARVSLKNNLLSCISGEVKNACIYSKPLASEKILLANTFGSSQSIGATAVNLIMPSNGSIDLDDSARGAWYSNSTGVFTALVDCYDIDVQVSIKYTSPSSTNQTTLELIANGSTVDSQVLSGGYPQKAMLNARYLAAGQTISVRIAGSGSYVLDGTSGTKMLIKSRTGQGRS